MSAPRRKARRASLGFTLIEMLVALLILSIMSALGYSTYRAARISAERTEVSLKRSREIEFGMRIMTQDFAEAVPRPVRDMLGQSRLPAMRGTAGGGTVTATASELGANITSSSSSTSAGASASLGMSFSSGSSFGTSSDSNVVSMVDLTRAGWSNTAGMQRSTLQRVSYALVGDVLKRSYQTSLDTVLGNKPVVQDLLSGVQGVQLRYLDGNQTWQNQWPASSSTVAIEIIIQFKDWGAIRRLVEVSG
jgi:general secretion pathway protein J